MTLGDVIANFGQYIVNLWPFRAISDWEQGAYLRAGQVKRLLTSTNGIRGSGIHFFIPFLDEILVMDASVEVAEGAIQTCITSDQYSVAFQLAIRYRIVDASKVYQTIYEVKETVASQARASAGELVATLPAVDKKDKGYEFSAALAEEVYGDLHERFEEWGIELQAVALSSCVFCDTYRIITEGGSSTLNFGGM